MDTAVNNFEWCGYHWKCEMDGGRIIHSEFPWYWYSLDTIRICEDNSLEFYIKHNPKEVKHWDGKIYHPEYEISMMRSIEEFSYGVFSAEMMMPTGKNIGASFWLTGSGNWPPEIDIEEGWIEKKDTWFRFFEEYFPWIRPGWRTTTNVHYRENDLTKTHVGSRNIPFFKQPKNPAENWIEYKCIWKPNSITFYANGKKVREITGEVCRKMEENLKDPEKGYRMNVIFNNWCDNPAYNDIQMYTPMRVRNFKYQPYTIYYKN